jgi:hypothetical protein
MSSTAGTGSKTSIPNEQKMAGSLCYSIVTRSDVSLTRRVSFFLNAIFLRVHCVESNDICVCISARSPEIEHFLSRPRFGRPYRPPMWEFVRTANAHPDVGGLDPMILGKAQFQR